MSKRNKIRAEIKRFHRSSCYPDAMDVEADLLWTTLLALLADPDDRMVAAAGLALMAINGTKVTPEEIMAAIRAAMKAAGE